MTSFALYMAANLYDTLVRADVDFNLSPALATEWSSSADAKTWTFKLRDGVTFHNGKKLTGADVVYSVQRILNAKLASPALSNISPFLKPTGISPKPTGQPDGNGGDPDDKRRIDLHHINVELTAGQPSMGHIQKPGLIVLQG
jgi:ABC-type transport system substrate-binding protein